MFFNICRSCSHETAPIQSPSLAKNSNSHRGLHMTRTKQLQQDSLTGQKSMPEYMRHVPSIRAGVAFASLWITQKTLARPQPHYPSKERFSSVSAPPPKRPQTRYLYGMRIVPIPTRLCKLSSTRPCCPQMQERSH